MPNHCCNALHITCPEDQLRLFRAFAQGNRETLDINKFARMPQEVLHNRAPNQDAEQAERLTRLYGTPIGTSGLWRTGAPSGERTTFTGRRSGPRLSNTPSPPRGRPSAPTRWQPCPTGSPGCGWSQITKTPRTCPWDGAPRRPERNYLPVNDLALFEAALGLGSEIVPGEA